MPYPKYFCNRLLHVRKLLVIKSLTNVKLYEVNVLSECETFTLFIFRCVVFAVTAMQRPELTVAAL